MKEKYAEEISVNAVSALEKLKDGNARFICASDVSETCLPKRAVLQAATVKVRTP